MNRAIERHQCNEARTIPVIIRDCDWLETPLKVLQGIPRDNQAVASRGDRYARDTPWKQVAREIGEIAKQLQAKLEAKKKARLRQEGMEAYQQKAEEIFDGAFSPGQNRLLEKLAKNHQLSKVDVQRIRGKVETAYQSKKDAIQDFRVLVLEEISHYGGLTDRAKETLQSLRPTQYISEADAKQIEQKVLVQWQQAEEEQRQLERQQEAEREAKRKQQKAEKERQEWEAELTRQQEEQERQKREEEEHQNHLPSSTNEVDQLHTFSFDVVLLDAKGKEKQRTQKSSQYFAETLAPGIDLEMVAIPGGQFLMGSPDVAGYDPNVAGYDDERPQHQVHVPPFFLGKYPVTQAQWRAVAVLEKVKIDLTPEPSGFKGNQRPVEMVSWLEAVEFCDRISHHTGNTYQLPSEAEWEYACRAGTTTPYHFGSAISPDFANFDNAIGQTSDVGHFRVANDFGLFDMHGNVWEWCFDKYQNSYIGSSSEGLALVSKNDNYYRLLRGGSWGFDPGDCRSARRYESSQFYRFNIYGFRVMCVGSLRSELVEGISSGVQ